MPAEALASREHVIGPAEVAHRRILRALRTRRRYRYVKPTVRERDGGFVVTSPCCSRSVDRDGGVIEIAWIESTGVGWRLHRRDYAANAWAPCDEGPLPRLLDLLCSDPDRLFWP
jgi:hypothetical protein